MSEMDPKNQGSVPPRSERVVYVAAPEPEPGVVVLTLDQCLLEIAETYRQAAPLNEKLENQKAVAKQLMKQKGLTSYEHIPTGIKALFYDSNQSEVNKPLAKEICGARWAEVETFKKVTSFKVTVPGVKSPKAK